MMSKKYLELYRTLTCEVFYRINNSKFHATDWLWDESLQENELKIAHLKVIIEKIEYRLLNGYKNEN